MIWKLFPVCTLAKCKCRKSQGNLERNSNWQIFHLILLLDERPCANSEPSERELQSDWLSRSDRSRWIESELNVSISSLKEMFFHEVTRVKGSEPATIKKTGALLAAEASWKEAVICWSGHWLRNARLYSKAKGVFHQHLFDSLPPLCSHWLSFCPVKLRWLGFCSSQLLTSYSEKVLNDLTSQNI